MLIKSRKRKLGASIIELMVAVALLGGLTALAASLIRHGSNYLRTTTAQLDTQKDALLALNWMLRDLSEASPVAIHTNSWGSPHEPPQAPLPGPPRGVVFASPRDANGQVSYGGTAIQWNSRVCYFLDIPGGGNLYRVVKTHPAESLPRLINPNNEDTSDFQSNLSSLPHRILAQNVSYLDVQRQAAGIEIKLEAANSDRSFTVYVSTLVHPKN